MEAPALQDGLQQRLAAVRWGLHLRWNPRSKVLRRGTLDIYGVPRDDAVYDGRWELWDTDADGKQYKVMDIRTADDRYMPPGDWLLELLHIINPENHGGDVSKMMAKLVDNHNLRLTDLGDREIEDLAGQAAKWHIYADAPKTRVLTNL